MVRLSVIIPGYNTPKAWWKRSVGSVLKAIGHEDEVICAVVGHSCISILLEFLHQRRGGSSGCHAGAINVFCLCAAWTQSLLSSGPGRPGLD